jgi:peroxiredoxin
VASEAKLAPLSEVLSAICAMDAPLGAKLAAYSNALRERNSPFVDAYDSIVARLRSGEAGATAPKVGAVIPPFVLPDGDGRMVGLNELVAEGPLVVSFNRGHWCPFCKIELSSLAGAAQELAKLDAKVVSIMPDRQSFIGSLAGELRGKVSFLSDIDNAYALSLGLAMWVGEPVRALMSGIGWRLDAFQGNDAWFLPLPATFVVGPDGVILARFVDANFRERMEIADILKALRSIHR